MLRRSGRGYTAILRHANLSTTMTHYVKTTPVAVHDAMAKLESAVPVTVQ